MNRMVMLDYTFLFEPDNTWGHLYQFEQELANYLRGKGFEADIVKAIEGQQGRRILLIKRSDKLMTVGNNPPPHAPQDQLKKLQNPFKSKGEKKGYFVPTKGYLKR